MKGFKELKDGAFLVYLVKSMLVHAKNADFREHAAIQIDDVNDRFALIHMVFMAEFLIEEGFDLNQAMLGDEIELAKISLIILSYGVSMENKEINESFEKLDKIHYETMELFYSITESLKSSFPPTTINVYERFLFMPNKTTSNKRVSIVEKKYASSSSKFSPESPSPKTSTADAYLLSPMAKANLNSPRDKHLRKKVEEEFFLEKKRLEKEITNKDNLIYDLQFEIHDKKTKIDEIEIKLVEYERKQVEFNK